MPRSHWIIAVAFGLTVFSPAFGQNEDEPIVENEPASSSEQDEDGNGSDDNGGDEQSFTFDLVPSLGGIESAIRDLKAEEGEAEREQQQRNESRDLQAQEGMAFWAMWMFWAAFGTVVLTAIALWAIIRTLHHTKIAAQYTGDMLEQARRATVAAEDAVVVTKQMGIMQTRAYISILGATLHEGIGSYRVDILIKNVGNSPAKDVTVFFRVSDESFTLDPDPNLTPVKSHPLIDMLGGGIEEQFSFGFVDSDIFNMHGNPSPGRVGMVEIIIGYRTVFDLVEDPMDLQTAARLLPDKSRKTASLSDIGKYRMVVMSILLGGWIKTFREKHQKKV